MIGTDQQNEVLQQVKQLELAVDSDSGLERSAGSSVQEAGPDESLKTTEKRLDLDINDLHPPLF